MCRTASPYTDTGAGRPGSEGSACRSVWTSDAYLVKIADELTIVGSPAVGAVRMVTAAALPQEIVANVYLGERIRDEQDGVYEELGVIVARELRPTKEYPKGQEVYSLTFPGGGGDPATAEEPSADTGSPPA